MSGMSVTLGPIRDHGPECRCQFHDAKRDPAGINTLQRRFEADLGRRFRRLKSLILQSLVSNDALGLTRATAGPGAKLLQADGTPFPGGGIVTIVRDEALDPGRFVFARSSEKISGFMGWLRQQQNEGILDITEGTPIDMAAETAWTNAYVETSYQKGLRDAGAKLRKEGAQVAPTFIENAFSRPIHADRLGVIYTRTFTELKGITEAMDQQISRVLAQGIAEGQGPMVIARRMNERVDKIGITRARMLARTETINAHAEAALNTYEEAGIEGVDVEAEWLTAVGACPVCEALSDSGPYTLQEAHGMIPAHPNCRCAFAPKVVGGTGIELV